MIGFGGMGGGAVGGNSWPSASNLSALAPPFTVDRLSPNPNSTVEPYYNAWEYTPQSAVGSELFIDSIGVSSVPLSDAYRFSATSSSVGPSTTHWSSPMSPGAKDSACAFGYSSYDTCVGGEVGMLGKNEGLAAQPSANPAFDSAQSSIEWEYGRGWVDGLGFDNGKRPKMGQLDSNFWSNKANAVDSLYHNQLKQGVHSFENRNRYEGESVPFKLSNHAPDWGFNEGSSSVGAVKDASCLEQNTSFFSYDSNNASGSTNYPESNLSLLPCESPNNFSNYQSPCGLYKQFDKPADTPFFSRLTVRRPSPSVVIRSPHATDVSSVQSFASQLQEMNALSGFSMACGNAQVRSSTEIASDSVDPPNAAVDSPCWKGATLSKTSPFDLEAANCKHVEKNLNLNEYFDYEYKGLPSPFNSDRVLPEFNTRECARNDVLTLGRNVSAVSSNEEQSSSNCTMHRVPFLTTSNQKGVEIGCDSDKLKKDSELLHSLTGSFDLKGSDIKCISDEECPRITPNDASECSVVAVLAAEKVLASPASQEDTVECPKLNVLSVIKAIHNLSDLLLFHLSNDAFSLDEENLVSLRHIMSNLDSCVSKKAFLEKKPEPNNPMGETSKKLEDQSSNVEIISGSSHMVNKTANSHIQPYSQHLHQKEEICSFSGKKDEKSLHFTPFADDLDLSTNDNMIKAIQRVLEENFRFDEDMDSQSQLFKNLWLESEAKLCCIGYKARFDRMKIQMETMKLKAKENKYLLEMMSKDSVASGSVTASGHAIKSRDGTDPNPNSMKFPNSSLNELAVDIMERLSILNSQENNLNPINAEEEQEPEMDDELMARVNILKKPREENSKSVSTEGEVKHAMIGGKLTADVKPCIEDHSENKRLNWDLNSHFQCQTDILSLGKFDSYVDGVGCESPNEFYLSVTDNQATPSAESSTATNDQNTGGNRSYISVTNNEAIPSADNNTAMKDKDTGGDDSPSSDWEHVLKDDF